MQGALLAILLFAKKDNHAANTLLAFGMLALSIDVFHSAYIIFGYYASFPHLIGISFAFPFLYGPIFYLYAKLVSTDNNSFKLKYYLHFIPFMLMVLYGLILVYFKSADFKLALARNELESPLPLLLQINYLKPVHGMIYVFLTIKIVRIFNTRIKYSYSNIERINLSWLMHLTISLSIIWSIVVLSFVVNAVSEKNIQMDHFIYLAASVLIYSIGYFSLRQPQIFSPGAPPIIIPAESESSMPLPETASYRKSGLTGEEAQSYQKKLLQVMETDKPYLNNDLTLRELADKLSMSTHNLSEILNTRLNQSFYDFINGYRVEEVKRRLADKESERYNLLSIAFDSGFNSKSAFNTIFKKHTGVTPSHYRRQLN